ncbi:hypothetical protein ACQYRI_04275 [Salmonella enterica]
MIGNISRNQTGAVVAQSRADSHEVNGGPLKNGVTGALVQVKISHDDFRTMSREIAARYAALLPSCSDHVASVTVE